jgi:hypothetical protein
VASPRAVHVALVAPHESYMAVRGLQFPPSPDPLQEQLLHVWHNITCQHPLGSVHVFGDVAMFATMHQQYSTIYYVQPLVMYSGHKEVMDKVMAEASGKVVMVPAVKHFATRLAVVPIVLNVSDVGGKLPRHVEQLVQPVGRGGKQGKRGDVR